MWSSLLSLPNSLRGLRAWLDLQETPAKLLGRELGLAEALVVPADRDGFAALCLPDQARQLALRLGHGIRSFRHPALKRAIRPTRCQRRDTRFAEMRRRGLR